MFEKIFLQILNMSFTASLVILSVLMARLLLKKSPKYFSYTLWGVVLFRLICPFSFESVFSLLPAKTNPISQDIIYAIIPTIDTGIPAINHTVNQLLPAATPTASVNPLQIWIFIGTIVWLLGIAILLIYSIVSFMKLQRRLKNAVHEKNNIYLAERLDTPFVMGIIRPKIYLPTSLTMEEKRYILLHEQMHIRRFDHVVKILSFFVLCLHWFNPLVWVAFFISGKDMEMSCDEAVIKQLGSDVKKEYSSSLLTLATGKRIIGGTPLAFGEGDTKERIKNVLNYKKPTFWLVVVALITTIIIGGGLLANPMNNVPLLDARGIHFLSENLDSAIYGTLTSGNQVMDFSTAKVPEFADFIKELKVDKTEVTLPWDREQNSINQIHLVYESFGNDGTTYNAYFNFNADFTMVWVDNDVKPSPSYRVKRPEEVKTFFERQRGSVTQIFEVGSAGELWNARTQYVGDNSAVGKLLGLLPLPAELHHKQFELLTNGNQRGVKWVLGENENAIYNTNDLNPPALLLFALIDNLEDFYIIIKDPYGGGTELHFNREWANNQVGGDVRIYVESPEKLEELIGFSVVKDGDVQAVKNANYSQSLTAEELKQTEEIVRNYFTTEAPYYEGIVSIELMPDDYYLYKNHGIEGEYEAGNIIIYKLLTVRDKKDNNPERSASVARASKNAPWELINHGY